MTTVNVYRNAGDFAENKDVAKDLRIKVLMPALAVRGKVVVDFTGVSLSTQSFVHALISDAIRKHGIDILDYMTFKGCNPAIRALVSTVCDYMQDTGHAPEETPSESTRKQVKKSAKKAKG